MITVSVYCENIIIVTYICTPKYYIFTNAIYSTAKMWNKMKSKKYHSRNIFKKSDRKSVKEAIRYLRLYSEYNLISPNRYGREEICNQTRQIFTYAYYRMTSTLFLLLHYIIVIGSIQWRSNITDLCPGQYAVLITML